MLIRSHWKKVRMLIIITTRSCALFSLTNVIIFTYTIPLINVTRGGGIYFYLLMEKTLLLLRNAIHFLVIATEQNKYIQISMQESECYIEKFWKADYPSQFTMNKFINSIKIFEDTSIIPPNFFQRKTFHFDWNSILW